MGAAVPYIISGISQKLSTGDVSLKSWVPHDIEHALFDPANLDGKYTKDKLEKEAKEEQKKAQEEIEKKQAEIKKQAETEAEKKRREGLMRRGMMSTIHTSPFGVNTPAATAKKTLLGQ
jgi:Skp family chaperone for outer membrane proteins